MPPKLSGVHADRRRGTGAGTVRAVGHALQILRCLSGEGPLRVGELASRVGLHKSTVSRLVGTLQADDLVEREPASRRVQLGPGLVSLCAPLLGRIRIGESAGSHLAELAALSGETVSLSVWDGAGAVNLEQAAGGRAIKHYAPPGSRNPAHCTAAGKLLLAYAAPAVLERVIARGLARYTPRTITAGPALRAEIAAVRQKGCAVNLGEFAIDVGAIAVPVRNGSGEVVAAVAATVPMYRFQPTRRAELLDLLRVASDAVSADVKRFGEPFAWPSR